MSALLAPSTAPQVPAKQVKVLSQYAAEAWREFGRMPLISITFGGRQAEVRGDYVLRLEFDDVPPDVPGAPTQKHAESIKAFCARHADSDIIAVHCRMGVSRSAAVGVYLRSLGYVCHEDLSRANRGLCVLLGVKRPALGFETPPESESP